MEVQVNNINIHYKKVGDGFPLIMIHGNGENHHIFDKASEVLSKKYTVYLIDSRGHGKSEFSGDLHYEDMALDIYEIIKKLGIEKPIFYGFSDGGILGIILAIKYPNLFKAMVISGVNIKPEGIKRKWLLLFKLIYKITKSKAYYMMLTEPNIDENSIKGIRIPTFITAGSRDMISLEHIKYIAKLIPNSTMKIFDGEGHGSYIVNNSKIAEYILEAKIK